MLPFSAFVWGYQNSPKTTLYMIFDFKLLLSKLKTEVHEVARIESVEAAIEEARLAALNEPPRFVGFLISEWVAEVDE